ncbi:MAG TPA: HAD hydrolase family protein [Clostridium sp.]
MTMLEFVKVGVAMGNAKDELKIIDNDITDTHDEDGIYNSFKKYELI